MAQQTYDEGAWLDALAERQRLDVFGDIAGAIAHQLNNALSVVNGYEELLLEAFEDPADGPEARAVMRTRAQTVHTWTGTALAVARRLHAMAAHLREEAGPVSVNDLVAEAVDLCRYRCEREGIVLITDLADSLPAVHARPGQLLQIFINLVHNAREAIGRMQAATESSEAGTIRLATAATPAGVEVVVEDDGPGVPPDEVERIFAVGVSLGAPTQGQPLRGLGLPVSRRLAQRLGGSLVARPGDGGFFRLELPATAS